MPLAGAGSTSGAVFGSGRGGNGICGPRGGRWAGVVVRGGAGDDPPSLGFGAIAEVERRLSGRRDSGTANGPGVLDTGGEVGGSGLVVWVREEDGFVADFEVDTEEGSFWERDWDRCRRASSDAFFLLS